MNGKCVLVLGAVEKCRNASAKAMSALGIDGFGLHGRKFGAHS